MNFIKIFFLEIPLIILAHPVLAGESENLFLSEEIINIELRSDFSAIQKDRIEDPKYHEGELIFQSSDGESLRLSVKLMVRGNFRLDPANCSFPPLFIDFKKSEVKNTIFSNQSRLKLVTPCQDEKEVIEEYMIYKMYNIVTDMSLNARLVRILYFDTGSNIKLFEKYSFFIEDKDHAAERLNAVETDKFLTPFSLNTDNYKRLSVFQYIIGNKDWFVTSRKNIILYQPNDSTLAPFAIPYDFDLAGLVDAEYTKPEGVPDYLLKSRRIYKGICYSNDELNEIFEFYRALRPRFESLINNQALLSKPNRKNIITYIADFYKVIDSNNKIKTEFLDVCETRSSYNLK